MTGIITAVLSALFMATIGVFSKITGFGAETVTFFRLGFGAGFMLLFLLFSGQAVWVKKWPSWPVMVNGGLLAGFIIFYVQAMSLTTMANAIMLVYLAPICSSVYAHYFLKERLSGMSVGMIGLALLGFAMMMEFKIDYSPADNHLLGLGFGVLSMLSYTGFILINRMIDQQIHVYTSTFYQLLTGAGIMLLFFLNDVPEISSVNWLWLMATGFFPGFLGILCAVIALSKLPAATFGTLAYCEPVCVIIFGWVIFGERLSPLQMSGCALILVSGILKAYISTRGGQQSVAGSGNSVSREAVPLLQE